MPTPIPDILREITRAERAAAADIRELTAEIEVRHIRAATAARLWLPVLAGPEVREAIQHADLPPPPARAPLRFLAWARRQPSGQTPEQYRSLWGRWAAGIAAQWRREAAASPRVQQAIRAITEDSGFGRREPLTEATDYLDRLREARQALISIRSILRRAVGLGINSVEIEPDGPLIQRAVAVVEEIKQHSAYVEHVSIIEMEQ